jgi:maltodextrin utilization protein YvdJ
MNKIKFLQVLIIALFLSNLLVVYFAIQLSNNRGFNPDGPKKLVIEKLHFDEQQISDYEVLIDGHRQQIREKNEAIRHQKQALYQQLNAENDSLKVICLLEIAKLQAQVEEIHYKHFIDIKKLCKPEQLDNYEAFSKEILKIFPANQAGKHPKP